MQGPQYLFNSVYSVIIYIENLTEGKVTNWQNMRNTIIFQVVIKARHVISIQTQNDF